MPVAQTVLEQIEYNVLTGHTFIQWRKQILADNGAVIFAESHRISLEPQRYPVNADGSVGLVPLPATDVTTQIAAVDAHLVKQGWPATAPGDKTIISFTDTQRLAFVASKPVGVTSV